MTFTLNAGEFDLGGGYIGRGNVIIGESNTSPGVTLQNLLNTSGLQGISYSNNETVAQISFRSSNDPNLSGTIGQGTTFSWLTIGSPSNVPNNARLHLSLNTYATGSSYNGYANYINSSSSSNGEVLSIPAASYPVGNGSPYRDVFTASSANWRFLTRDHATALTHYPTTTEQGSVFAASCVNSPTQWGFWCAGEVGNRSGYFNQTQGYFSIVILRNGSTWYLSAFSPAAADSTSRNDSLLRSPNITPLAGQSGDDRFSELFITRDQGSGTSEVLGKVPGMIYVDMNKAANALLVVDDKLNITPGTGTTYGITNRGAIIVAQWGFNISATISNTGSTFTVDTASTPSSETLGSGNRSRTTLEDNQRIRFTATPPTGLSIGTDYWVRDWNKTAFTFSLATSEGGTAIVPGSNASSTITRYSALIAMPCYKA